MVFHVFRGHLYFFIEQGSMLHLLTLLIEWLGVSLGFHFCSFVYILDINPLSNE